MIDSTLLRVFEYILSYSSRIYSQTVHRSSFFWALAKTGRFLSVPLRTIVPADIEQATSRQRAGNGKGQQPQGGGMDGGLLVLAAAIVVAALLLRRRGGPETDEAARTLQARVDQTA